MSIVIPGSLLPFLQTHGYWIMFIIMVIEGPIVTYVAAFAASIGAFNIYLVFLLSLFGNIVGDAVLYFIGSIGRNYVVQKYAVKFISQERIEKIENYLKSNPGKTITVIKLTPPLPVPGLIISGAMGIRMKTFFSYSLIISLVYSLIFSILGFYSGIAFNQLAGYIKYSEFLIGAVVLLIIIVWILSKYISKRISRRIEEI